MNIFDLFYIMYEQCINEENYVHMY